MDLPLTSENDFSGDCRRTSEDHRRAEAAIAESNRTALEDVVSSMRALTTRTGLGYALYQDIRIAHPRLTAIREILAGPAVHTQIVGISAQSRYLALHAAAMLRPADTRIMLIGQPFSGRPLPLSTIRARVDEILPDSQREDQSSRDSLGLVIVSLPRLDGAAPGESMTLSDTLAGLLHPSLCARIVLLHDSSLPPAIADQLQLVHDLDADTAENRAVKAQFDHARLALEVYGTDLADADPAILAGIKRGDEKAITLLTLAQRRAGALTSDLLDLRPETVDPLIDAELINAHTAGGPATLQDIIDDIDAAAEDGKGQLVLITGESGTGKTSLAKLLIATMGKRRLGFTSADILDRFLGGNEEKLKAVLTKARENDQIPHIDEADILLTAREQAEHEWQKNLVNQLLALTDELDIPLVMTTNLAADSGAIDGAVRRRCAAILTLCPLEGLKAQAAWRHYDLPGPVPRLGEAYALSDFEAAARRIKRDARKHRPVSPAQAAAYLEQYREERAGTRKTIGFSLA